MKSKIIFSLALVLSARIAAAQPGGGFTYRSLEARIVQAPVVFRGIITHVLETVIHSNNQLSTYDIFNYAVTLKVEEVFKGNLPRQPLEFAINGVGKWGELETWADERVSFLWFLNDSGKSIGADFQALENFIFLGPTLPGRKNDNGFNNYPRVYGMDMTILTQPEDIVARARAFAKKRIDTTRLHSVYLPQQSSSDHYYFNSYLTVPVEQALEKTAKRLIAAPEDFISTKTESILVPQWRCDLRAEGVNALQYFKSAKNTKLLKSLLDDPDYWMIKDWSTKYRDMNVTNKIYSVRKKAYEVLNGWGVDVPKPVTAETIPAKET